MNWTELCITISSRHLEEAAAVAALVAEGGISIEDYSDLEEQAAQITRAGLIDQELLARDRTQARIRLYLTPGPAAEAASALLNERLLAADIPFSLSSGTLREEDWADAWRRYYHPVELSERLAVCPTWEDYTPRPGQRVVRLDPGMAFGTGTHETTRLCLSLIERYLTPGARVLDVGCGSGILSIAARLLGAKSVTGIDIDPVAVRVAAENAAVNGCADIAFLQGDLAGGAEGRYDVILGNLVADVIVRLAPDLPARLSPGGVCVLSGILEERAADLALSLALSGLVQVETKTENGWAAIVCRRGV